LPIRSELGAAAMDRLKLRPAAVWVRETEIESFEREEEGGPTTRAKLM
jgi:hypothetical protein